MKPIGTYLVLALSFFSLAATSQKTKYNFNPGWKVFVGDDSSAIRKDFNDKGWKNVTLPYAWHEDEAFKTDIRDLSDSIACI